MHRSYKKLMGNFGKLLFGNVGSMLLGLVTQPLIIQSLPVEEYGLYTIVLSSCSILGILMQLVSSNVVIPIIIRLENDNKMEEAKKYILFFVYAQIAIGFFSIIVGNLILLLFYGIDNIQILIPTSLYMLLSQGTNLSVAFSLLYKKYNIIASVSLIRSFTKFVIIITLMFLEEISDAQDIITVIVMCEALTFIASLRIYKLLIYKYRNIKCSSWFKGVKILNQSIYIFLSSLMYDGFNIVLTAIISKLYSVEMVALYGVINKLISITSSFYKLFENSIFPYLVMWLKKKSAGANIALMHKGALTITLIGIVIFNLNAEYFIDFFAGEKYIVYSGIFSFASFYTIIISLQMMQRALIYSIGKVRVLFNSTLIAILINSIIIFLFYMYDPNMSLKIIYLAKIIGDLASYYYKKIKINNIVDFKI